MKSPEDPRDDGYTLIEILASLAIIGLVLPIVMMAFMNSARSRSVSVGRTTAAYLLRDKLAELEATGVPEPGEDAGEFEEGSRYQWSTSVTETDVEGLFDVVVTISWMEQGLQREYAVRTYMADPAVTQETTGQGAQAGGGAPPGGPAG
ncbi:prepilin-type N-terminal cleavage/methylation domain-containing protein [Candidatus Poribacteria bacterium]|nr:prepilin-type N-terminal cleavage/methylation domain-containing protein [Candidatus Poribacteria bacterium]